MRGDRPIAPIKSLSGPANNRYVCRRYGEKSVRTTGTFIWAAPVLLAMAATPSSAQTDERGVAVGERQRPGYEPYGYRLGSVTLYPSVGLTGDYSDNYRATDSNRQSDFYLTVSPEVRLASDWSRHRLTAQAFFSQQIHAKLRGEDVSQYGASVGGTYDVSRQTSFGFDLSARHASESRSALGSFRGTLEPVEYDTVQAAVSVSHNFNRLDLNGSAGAGYVNYGDIFGLTGLTIDQDFRDVRTVFLAGGAQYDIGPGLGIVVSGRLDDSRYRFRPGRAGFDPLINIDRASSGYSLQAGLAFELSSLVFGNVQVGVLDRNYDDPRLQDFNGLSFSGDILWNVTPLTSVRFRAARTIEDTSSTIVAGNTRSEFRVSVDHELYRYLILSGDAVYAHFSPNGVGVGGNEYSAGVRARYLIDRRFSVTGGLRYSNRTSDSNFLRYNAFGATIGVNVAF